MFQLLKKESLFQQMFFEPKKGVKKLVLVLATSIPVIVISRKVFESVEIAKASKDGKNSEYLGTNLVQVLYVQYPITFWKKSVSVLFNSGSKVNIIYPIFAKEPGFPIRPTDVGV